MKEIVKRQEYSKKFKGRCRIRRTYNIDDYVIVKNFMSEPDYFNIERSL